MSKQNAPEIRILRPGEEPVDHVKEIEWAEGFARLLDSRFVIPGTKIRFGLDPVFSLIPVLGDLITYAISGVLIYTMYQHGASRKVVIKMILNSTLDAVLGAIPLVGTLFDVAYRSNDRNVRLLKEYYFEGKHQGSGKGLVAVIAITSILLVAAAVFGVYKLFEAIL